MVEDEVLTQADIDEAAERMARRTLAEREHRARQKKLIQKLLKQTNFVVFGGIVGIVVRAVDELENVCIGHEFFEQNGKIAWARETNARADAVATAADDLWMTYAGGTIGRQRGSPIVDASLSDLVKQA